MTLPKLTLQEAVKNSKERIQHLKSQQQIFDSDLSELIQSETAWQEELIQKLRDDEESNNTDHSSNIKKSRAEIRQLEMEIESLQSRVNFEDHYEIEDLKSGINSYDYYED